MAATAKKTKPELWEKVKAEVTAGDKGGHAGEWSARKAQMAVQRYKAEGGGYEGRKTADNHLVEWGREDWGTKSGEPSGKTGERYLPRKAREALSPEEYARTTRKKRADSRKGKQHSAQPEEIARKTAPFRQGDHPATRAQLYAEAKRRQLPGRSTMNRNQLAEALGR